jgi:hypothetical protein
MGVPPCLYFVSIIAELFLFEQHSPEVCQKSDKQFRDASGCSSYPVFHPLYYCTKKSGLKQIENCKTIPIGLRTVGKGWYNHSGNMGRRRRPIHAVWEKVTFRFGGDGADC